MQNYKLSRNSFISLEIVGIDQHCFLVLLLTKVGSFHGKKRERQVSKPVGIQFERIKLLYLILQRGIRG